MGENSLSPLLHYRPPPPSSSLVVRRLPHPPTHAVAVVGSASSDLSFVISPLFRFAFGHSLSPNYGFYVVVTGVEAAAQPDYLVVVDTRSGDVVMRQWARRKPRSHTAQLLVVGCRSSVI